MLLFTQMKLKDSLPNQQMPAMPMEYRSARSRGMRKDSWVTSYYSFSFSDYYHPSRTHFSKLRAINDDVIAPNTGFDTHPHRDMEIITYVLSGALQHADNLGHQRVIDASQVQAMSAGSGLVHSEHNPSLTEHVHLLQIWVMPRQKGLTPSYAQTEFSTALKRQRWCLIASPNGEQGSLLVQQDMRLWATVMQSGEHMQFAAQPGRACYVHVAKGQVNINQQQMMSGDALAIQEWSQDLVLNASSDAEILLFDLPKE